MGNHQQNMAMLYTGTMGWSLILHDFAGNIYKKSWLPSNISLHMPKGSNREHGGVQHIHNPKNGGFSMGASVSS